MGFGVCDPSDKLRSGSPSAMSAVMIGDLQYKTPAPLGHHAAMPGTTPSNVVQMDPAAKGDDSILMAKWGSPPSIASLGEPTDATNATR
jgi:hypothetical protein